jgi:hypothetical protein
LVHRWAFDGDTTDRSGSGNDGDTFGSISYTDGVVGQALLLDDLDDLVENENANNLPIEPDDLWSLNVWYNLELFPSLAYGGGFGGRMDDTRVRSFLSFGPGGGGEERSFGGRFAGGRWIARRCGPDLCARAECLPVVECRVDAGVCVPAAPVTTVSQSGVHQSTSLM